MSEHDDADVIEQVPRQAGFPAAWRLRVTFTGLATSRSPLFEHLAPVDGWTFYGSRYTSRYVAFVPVERYSNVLVNATANPDAASSYRVLQPLTPPQQAIFARYDKSGATPFLDFANRAVQ